MMEAYDLPGEEETNLSSRTVRSSLKMELPPPPPPVEYELLIFYIIMMSYINGNGSFPFVTRLPRTCHILHNDLLCNDTCSIVGGAYLGRGGGHKGKYPYKYNVYWLILTLLMLCKPLKVQKGAAVCAHGLMKQKFCSRNGKEIRSMNI